MTCTVVEDGEPDMVEWYEYVTVDQGSRIWYSLEDPSEVDHPEIFEIVGTWNLKMKNISIYYGGKYGCRLITQDEVTVAYVSVFSKYSEIN